MIRKPLIPLAFLASAVVLAWSAYYPGLSGDFHFDDQPNLSPLGAYGGVTDWESLLAYFQSAVASELGRPVAMATFLVNATDWPADPRPFLITNISLHALNGFLLFLCLWLLCTHAQFDSIRRRGLALAFMAGAFWVLHPFLVSTTLYVVQRMAMLSAFFTLLAILFYLWARLNVLNGTFRDQPWRFALVAAVLGILTALSILSKENGVLTPLLVLVVEYFGIRPLWRTHEDPKSLRVWITVVLIGPSLVVVWLLLERMLGGGIHELVSNRNFTHYERLMSQPAILVYYLNNLFLPQPSYPGLFYDGHPLRVGSLADWRTLASLALLISLTGLALYFQKTFPFLALAVFFFLTGHLVESLVLGLEPMFEHRNYLPSVFLFLPVAYGLVLIPRPAFRTALVTLIGAMLLVFTHSHASLWGQPTKLIVYWATENPWSTRAQITAVDRLLREARFDVAFDLLEASREQIQNSAPLLVTQLTAERKLGIENDQIESLALQAFREGSFDRHLPKISEVIVDNYIDRDPPLMTLDFVDEVLEILINREDYQGLMFQTNLRSVRLRVSLYAGRYREACQDARKVLSLTNRVETPILFGARFATAGHYQDALDLYRIARRQLGDPEADRRFPVQWYSRELERLELTVKEEMQEAADEAPKSCGFSIDS